MSDNHSNYLVGLSPFNERGRARLCCLNINCNVDFFLMQLKLMIIVGLFSSRHQGTGT